jgi:hypothetical protein
MIKIKTTRPVGARIADIGANGREYNIRNLDMQNNSYLEIIQSALFCAYDLRNAMTSKDKQRPTENENFGDTIAELIAHLEALEVTA